MTGFAASDSDPMRVLIAGCGYVGTALGRRLARAGHTVWGLRRHPEALPDGIRPLAADLADPATLGGLPEPVDVVAYTAGAGRGSGPDGYRSVYVDGLRNLLRALPNVPGRILFTSSTGVYWQTGGEWVDERSPTEPIRETGRVLLEAERVARAAPAPTTIVRPGGIYGPDRTRLIDRVREGKAVCPAGEPIYGNRIHRDDVAGALHHLMRLDSPEPLYLLVDREPADRCAVYRWLAARLGAPEPPTGDVAPRRGNKRCRSDRLARSGFRFRYPTFREGYGAMVGEG